MKKHRSFRFLAVLLVASQLGGDLHSLEPAMGVVEVPTGVRVLAGGSEAVRQVDWPVDRLAAAGPALTIDVAASSPVADRRGPERAPAGKPLQIVGADAELAAAIREAVARFESAGLTLPELSIHAHPTSAGCRGSCGLFTATESGGRVDLCVRHQHTILHELAHAWEHHNVDDATRQRFLTYSGLESWYDPEADWDERGIEEAAQTIAWGLLHTPITKTDRFERQLDQFEVLTGFESPRL